MTPEQCRAGRALLDWLQEELARRSGLAVSSLRAFEGGKSRPIRNNMVAIQGALEQAGVILVAEDDVAGPGVRLAKRR